MSGRPQGTTRAEEHAVSIYGLPYRDGSGRLDPKLSTPPSAPEGRLGCPWWQQQWGAGFGVLRRNAAWIARERTQMKRKKERETKILYLKRGHPSKAHEFHAIRHTAACGSTSTSCGACSRRAQSRCHWHRRAEAD